MRMHPRALEQGVHAWIDYRNRRETRGDGIDYFENSITATLAHRAFCLDLAHDFPAFGPNIWGITASDSAKGYLAWGGPPRDPDIDGTIVPSAAGGSLMFTPELSLAALRAMRDKYGERIYGKYGFADAFNPNTGWIDTDVIGINAGIILLSAENARTGNVWNWFMRNREIPRAMRLAGLLRYQKKQLRIKKLPELSTTLWSALTCQRFGSPRPVAGPCPSILLRRATENSVTPRIQRQGGQTHHSPSG